MDKEMIEDTANNFSHEYFLHYDIGDWKQIKDYGKDIPKIVKAVVVQACGYNDRELFKEIINDINNI